MKPLSNITDPELLRLLRFFGEEHFRMSSEQYYGLLVVPYKELANNFLKYLKQDSKLEVNIQRREVTLPSGATLKVVVCNTGSRMNTSLEYERWVMNFAGLSLTTIGVMHEQYLTDYAESFLKSRLRSKAPFLTKYIIF